MLDHGIYNVSSSLNTFFYLGKTNHGRILYGRATRHKNVLLCPVGALALYLSYRFQVTQEFLHDVDWTKNETWFYVKLLVDPLAGPNGNFSVPMKTDAYGKAMKKVQQELHMIVSHLAHLGRTLGAKILEMLEVESDEIRRLGNWNPSIQDASYSTKLPMKPIRRLAGFATGNGLHYNKRTVVQPSQELQQMTPIGKWVFSGLQQVYEANTQGAGKYTAQNFLEFMKEINIVFLQDMAVIANEHPARLQGATSATSGQHVLLQYIPCLRSDEFKVSFLVCSILFF